MHLLSSDLTAFLSALQLSILSEVYYLKFLRIGYRINCLSGGAGFLPSTATMTKKLGWFELLDDFHKGLDPLFAFNVEEPNTVPSWWFQPI